MGGSRGTFFYLFGEAFLPGSTVSLSNTGVCALHNICKADFNNRSASTPRNHFSLSSVCAPAQTINCVCCRVLRTYKSRGVPSLLILAFAVFLVGLGLWFLFGAFGVVMRDFRIGSEWIK